MKTLEEIRPLAAHANVIPLHKEFLPDLDTPITALLKLKRPGHRVFLLESVEVGEKLARFSFLGKDPLYTFTAKGRHIEIRGKERRDLEGDALAELQKFLGRFRGAVDPELPPFSGGAVGFVCYDAIRLVENVPASGKDDFHLPDLHFGIYESFLVFDHIKHKLSIVSNVLTDEFPGLEAAYAAAAAKIARLEADLARPLPPLEPAPAGTAAPPPAHWESNFTREGFKAGVEKCKEYIKAGDAFQIVLSQRFTTKPSASPLSIYRALRSINPSPYMYYLDYGDFEIVGASPETLVKVQNGRAETKPIAGTRRRGKDEAEDKALEKELLADAKERAEHLMLVDLGRNDIGRVSEFGSVEVTRFMAVERFSNVMHIVSAVQGRLGKDCHPLRALMSCLPAGTLSGAPKIRAMEIIDGLEPHRRGLYGGAICYMDFRGNLDSCIAIRTMLVKDGVAYVQAGGGIVADSDPQMEFEETKHKAQALMRAVDAAGKI
ncbi:MAG TPA: anthranilate synthase component I [Fibrobacteria bacterium]|nr:anthranilate synthase component I [Fibrobacteria bacterium]